MAPGRSHKYDALLRVRKRQENIKAMALAQSHRSVLASERQKSEIAEEQARMLNAAAGKAREQFDASDVRRYYQFENHLARLAVEKDSEIIEHKKDENEKRKDLEEAMKQRKMVEKLTEREKIALIKELNKNEQKLSDEAALNRAVYSGANNWKL